MKIKNKLSIIMVLLIASTTVFADIYVDGNGDVKIDETLTVTGETTSTGKINADGGIKVTGSATVSGETTSTGKINAEGGVAVNGNATVSGETTSTGIINANGGVEVTGNLNTDSLTVEGKLVVDSIEVRSTTGNTFGVGTFVNVANVVQKDWVTVWEGMPTATVSNEWGDNGAYRVTVLRAGGAHAHFVVAKLDMSISILLWGSSSSAAQKLYGTYTHDGTPAYFQVIGTGGYTGDIIKIEKWQDTTGLSAPSVPLDDGWEETWSGSAYVVFNEDWYQGDGRYEVILREGNTYMRGVLYSINGEESQITPFISDSSSNAYNFRILASGIMERFGADARTSYPIVKISKWKGSMTLNLKHTREQSAGFPVFTEEVVGAGGDETVVLPENPAPGDKLTIFNASTHEKGSMVTTGIAGIVLGPQCEITFTWRASLNRWTYDRGTLIDSYTKDNITVEKYAGGKMNQFGIQNLTFTSATSSSITITFTELFYNPPLAFASGDDVPKIDFCLVTVSVESNENITVAAFPINSAAISGILPVDWKAEGYWKDPQGE